MSGRGPAVWRETFRVRAGEVGSGGRLRLTSLCDWLQEAAGNHADALDFGSDRLREEGLAWVLSRLTLLVRALPRWREEVVVSTWPSGARRLWALREFSLAGADGGEIAVATSGWLILRIAGKRPVRPPAEIAAFAAEAPARLLDDPFDDLPAAAATGRGGAFRVGRYDLDINVHANNVSILRWLLEALPAGAGEAPLRLSAEFRGECFEGDRLVAAAEAGGGVSRVRLVRESDGREVARAVAEPGEDDTAATAEPPRENERRE